MLKKILFCIAISLYLLDISKAFDFSEATKEEKQIFTFGVTTCKDVQETDYPTIFVPGIGASWYSQEGYNETKVKRWIPDPISHAYDTLFYTFKQNGYRIADVFYKNEFTVDIQGNPKQSLYLFGYDWKKDNKVTATILTQLVGKILQKYEQENGCSIGKVNVIAHSMGGLVARAMLEDMCVKLNQLENGIFNIPKYEKRIGEIYDFKNEGAKCLNPISDFPINLNKFITISTPHRGAPKSYLVWEKGDLGATDGYIFETGMKAELTGIFSNDQGLYEGIHGYDKRFPDGIVGLGQLLPDVAKVTEFNSKIIYSDNKEFYKILPKNSFLEELNKSENIEKMWYKIGQKYISYYSTLVGDFDKNNIVGYEFFLNNTIKNYGRDIYEYYPKKVETPLEVMSVKRDLRGLGGDGTVPTNNLRLVPNDSKEGAEVTGIVKIGGLEKKKFESREIQCQNKNSVPFTQGSENLLFRRFGISEKYEICTHTKMPIAASIKVYSDISGNLNILNQERLLLLSYLGSANHTRKNYLGVNLRDGNKVYNYYSLLNEDTIGTSFNDENYNKTLTLRQVGNDKNDSSEISLNVSGTEGELGGLIRYDILSPINVLITDEQGRKIGIDPQTGRIINEIPGAWTSGDTEGSNEPEFFLIPQTGTGKVQHSIQTFGTGDGVYHIEMREIEKDQTAKKVLTIQGNAIQGFESDYRVEKKQKGGTQVFSYTPTSNFPAKLETVSNTFTTDNESFTLRYFLKGDGKKVSKLQVQTLSPSGKKETVVQDIKGKIDIACKEFGDYKVTLSLLDAQGNILKHIGAKKTLTITRPAPQKTLPDDEYIYIDIPTDGIPFGIYVPKKLR